MDRLRPAEPSDIEQLARLDAYVQELHFDAHPDIWKAPSIESSREFFQKYFRENDGVLVVSQDNAGTAVGYALIHVVDKPESSHKPARRVLDLEHLAVGPEHQGDGRGRELLAWVDEQARINECDFIELSVWQFNDRAISVYERQGFTAVSCKMMKR